MHLPLWFAHTEEAENTVHHSSDDKRSDWPHLLPGGGKDIYAGAAGAGGGAALTSQAIGIYFDTEADAAGVARSVCRPG